MRLPRARRSASTTIAAAALLCVLGSCGTSSTPSQKSPPVDHSCTGDNRSTRDNRGADDRGL